jgi:UDP-N-acetylmuramyl pentapeptide phosphotransferase/UDP-N-acetylglucosamine-1-phosphate transferase
LALSILLVFLSAFEFFSTNQTELINLSTILIISALPLFYFNFRKNIKVFLGDSGSLFLGGVVSIYVIYSLNNSYIIKEDYDLHKILFILSILVYPIVDLIRVFFLRIKMGKSPFIADNNHLHHLLLKKTNNHLISTLIIFTASLLFLIVIQLLF